MIQDLRVGVDICRYKRNAAGKLLINFERCICPFRARRQKCVRRTHVQMCQPLRNGTCKKTMILQTLFLSQIPVTVDLCRGTTNNEKKRVRPLLNYLSK